MRNSIRCVTVLATLLLVQACTERVVYDAIQNREKVLCQEQPRSEYQECMERTEVSYDSYKKNKEETEKTK